MEAIYLDHKRHSQRTQDVVRPIRSDVARWRGKMVTSAWAMSISLPT